MKNVMIGPNPNGLGGISRVVTLWKRTGILPGNFCYIVSTSDFSNKLRTFICSWFHFLFQLSKSSIVYIHTASFNSFYRKICFMVPALIFRNKIILHIHPTFFYDFICSFKGIRRKFFFFVIGRVDLIVVLTDEMRIKMVKIFPQMDIEVLPNPVDIMAMANKSNIARDPRRFIFLGWFNKGKGVYDLVDAAAILKSRNIDFKLDFYGTKEVEQLKEYVKNKDVADYVQVHGWLDEKCKIEALYRSSCLVLPSHTEGIPNVILEAMATGTPIVSTLVGGLVEILEDKFNAVIVEPSQPEDIADKLSWAILNPQAMSSFAANGFMHAKDYYNLPVIKKRFDRIIAKI